ncbi:MAG TPA: Ig-like domain-containing protein [Gemmatimonadaceae bacterium]|nr:Ig-like domain-containing protein [Gemmatimonadaceae bacterium]
MHRSWHPQTMAALALSLLYFRATCNSGTGVELCDHLIGRTSLIVAPALPAGQWFYTLHTGDALRFTAHAARVVSATRDRFHDGRCEPVFDRAFDVAVEWRSSAPDIVSVDDAGRVTARAPGSADITASAPALGERAELHIVVER